MKPTLYNKIDKTVLKQRIAEDSTKRATYSFYRYIPLTELPTLRDEFYQELTKLEVLGRIYLSTEGINAQFSLPVHHYKAFIALTHEYPCLKGVDLKQALEENAPSFHKLTIKIREKLVADGLSSQAIDIDLAKCGEKLTPLKFEEAMEAPESLVIDVRNHYEHEVGYFENALRFPVDTFRELLPHMTTALKGNEDRPLLMYCTGGIRCEKASAFLKQQGFKQVYQLSGGIIGYAQALRKQQKDSSKFKGKNFVFDNRLGERVSEEILSTCHQCENPCDTHINCGYEDCHLLFIQCADCRDYFDGCCSRDCAEKAALPIEEQRKIRRGKVKADTLMIHKSRHALSRVERRGSGRGHKTTQEELRQ